MNTLRRIQAPLARTPRAAQAAGPYVVDVTADGPDADINDGACDTGSRACTRRAATMEARDDGGPTLITFDPSLFGATLVLSHTWGAIQWAGAVVTGTARANCRVFIYKAIGNPAAAGRGGLRLGEIKANASSDWSISGLPAGLIKLDISAVTCQFSCIITGNTSEMSPRPALYLPVLHRP